MLPHRLALSFALVCLALAGRPARAQIVRTLPDFNGPFIGPGGPFPQPSLTVGTFMYALQAGQSVTSATITGTWGTAVQWGSTAGADIFLDGILVAQCLPLSPDCWEVGAPYRPWSFTFSPAQLSVFADGSATLTAVQTNNDVIRLGQPTLTLFVNSSTTTPEPATLLLVGTGLVALGGRGFRVSRRRR